MLQAWPAMIQRDPASATHPVPDYTALIGTGAEGRQDRRHPPLP